MAITRNLAMQSFNTFIKISDSFFMGVLSVYYNKRTKKFYVNGPFINNDGEMLFSKSNKLMYTKDILGYSISVQKNEIVNILKANITDLEEDLQYNIITKFNLKSTILNKFSIHAIICPAKHNFISCNWTKTSNLYIPVLFDINKIDNFTSSGVLADEAIIPNKEILDKIIQFSDNDFKDLYNLESDILYNHIKTCGDLIE